MILLNFFTLLEYKFNHLIDVLLLDTILLYCLMSGSLNSDLDSFE